MNLSQARATPKHRISNQNTNTVGRYRTFSATRFRFIAYVTRHAH